MYIAAHSIALNYNPGAFNVTGRIVSSAGTDTPFEAYADDTATPEQINQAIAEEARARCRANNENVDTDAPVVIFGAAVQVA